MAIRPLAEGRPSTDGPLQIKSVPSNVNTYVDPPSKAPEGSVTERFDPPNRNNDPPFQKPLL